MKTTTHTTHEFTLPSGELLVVSGLAESDAQALAGALDQSPITEAQAYDMGAKGAEPTESERLIFEAWMRGHCWSVSGTWDGKTYVHETEKGGNLHNQTMFIRRLWAAWRDRAALSVGGAAA